MAWLLEGKVAVVTGGASGIGREFAAHNVEAVVAAEVLGGARQGESPTRDLIGDTDTRSLSRL